MPQGFLNRLLAIVKPRSADNGEPQTLDLVEILRACCYDLFRLTEQILAHAKKAPYPHVAQRLRQIALEKQKTGSMLKEKLSSLHAHDLESRFALKSGKNHWERMVQDLEDQKNLESNFLEQAFRLTDRSPEISALLREAVAAQLPHKEAFLDLVARADPQADQS